MNFDKVKELYDNLDVAHWSDENRLSMDVFARGRDMSYLIRFGASGRQAYLYLLPKEQVFPVKTELKGEILFYGYEYGLFLGGDQYAELPEKEDLQPDPKSGDVWILDIPHNLDWVIVNRSYFQELAKERADQAGYQFMCAFDALELLKE